MFSIWAPVRPSIPSGFWTKSIVASETILLSSVIAKRWKACSLEVPGGRITREPRSASRFVARAKAFRPESVNSIVTTGPPVCWSFCALGFLMSEPESSESSSMTKNCCSVGGWFFWCSAWTMTMPCGTLTTVLPDGGPPPSSAFSSSLQAVFLG